MPFSPEDHLRVQSAQGQEGGLPPLGPQVPSSEMPRACPKTPLPSFFFATKLIPKTRKSSGSSAAKNSLFWAAFYAFPGGQLDATDAEARVENSPDAETAAMISCAARELFEELGVLAARGAESLTKGQRASLLDDLESGRMSWPALLRHYDLHLDARRFHFRGPLGNAAIQRAAIRYLVLSR